MKIKNPLSALLMGLAISTVAMAIDCNSDCGEIASFRYPCPTFSNPGRQCDGRDPGTYAACEVTKAASCELFQGLQNAIGGQVKDALKPNFNAQTFAAAVESGPHGDEEYLAKCEAAGIAICAGIGAQIGGPYGAAASGAAGVFVAYQLCHQSETW